jgi:hypothetical protein
VTQTVRALLSIRPADAQRGTKGNLKTEGKKPFSDCTTDAPDTFPLRGGCGVCILQEFPAPLFFKAGFLRSNGRRTMEVL